jgi:hypothetical protein
MLATEGRPHGPLAPYGYTVVGAKRDKTYVVDPERARIVREIFERYVAGYSLSRLARELNARGVSGIKRGVWSRQRLKTMLDNSAYAGIRRYGGETFPANWTPAGVTRAVRARASDSNSAPLLLREPLGTSQQPALGPVGVRSLRGGTIPLTAVGACSGRAARLAMEPIRERSQSLRACRRS